MLAEHAVRWCALFVVVSCSAIPDQREETGRGQQHNDISKRSYFVEHAVSWEQAWRAGRHLQPELRVGLPGCAVCTGEEIAYCIGEKALYDHCCCDRKFEENFPYVPHTCYQSRDVCEPVALNCAIYTRLRVCCCDHFTGLKWAISNATVLHAKTIWLILLFYMIVRQVFTSS